MAPVEDPNWTGRKTLVTREHREELLDLPVPRYTDEVATIAEPSPVSDRQSAPAGRFLASPADSRQAGRAT